MVTTNFSRNIKALRSEYGYTQTALAEALGISQTAVSGWETRAKIPNQDAIITSLCELFDCSKQDLFGYTDGYYARQAGNTIPPEPSSTYAPVIGNIAAGDPREAYEESGETHWVRPDVLEAHPDGFFLAVKGDSMDMALPDGCFAFIAPGEVRTGDIAAVKVNGDEATIKRVTIMDGLVVLTPESSNKEHRRRVIDSTDPDAPEVRMLGRVVWFDSDLL